MARLTGLLRQHRAVGREPCVQRWLYPAKIPAIIQLPGLRFQPSFGAFFKEI